MKRIFAIFLAAMLVFALVACENKTGEVTEPSTTIDEGYKNGDLTVRQKRILTQQGLPTYYEHLTERQKMSITEIEEFLRYAENKYGFICEYVDYVAEDMETGILTCMAAEGETREYIFYVYRELGDEIVDTYMNVACIPTCEQMVQKYFDESIPNIKAKVACLVKTCNITTLPIKAEQIAGNVIAKYWVFIDSANCNAETMKEIAENAKAWMEQNKLMGDMVMMLMEKDVTSMITSHNFHEYINSEYKMNEELLNVSADAE